MKAGGQPQPTDPKFLSSTDAIQRVGVVTENGVLSFTAAITYAVANI